MSTNSRMDKSVVVYSAEILYTHRNNVLHSVVDSYEHSTEGRKTNAEEHILFIKNPKLGKN